MTADPLESLLEQLPSGDPRVVAQIFVNLAPGLRALVRRRFPSSLRPKLDSEDVVLSVWTDVLDGLRSGRWSFRDAAHLRAFLNTAARNRLIDRQRQHRAAMERERQLSVEDRDALAVESGARPSATVRADDLWQQLLALCPPAHHELLRLKHQGLPLSEIAQRTGLHPSSVRRILYDLARQLAEVQSADDRDH
ncbi:MAG TPA: sigma-70 family RNA polymerase sigma factor [Pirellulales bacterium]|nr:sigma-70 family RNA polymerase sigma factor [Pirellulales bacterium]